MTIDLFVYHQANARITRAVGERLGLDLERVVDCIEWLGNASAATLPVALTTAERDGRLRPGARVLLSAFGAGFTWGAGVIEWGRSRTMAEPAVGPGRRWSPVPRAASGRRSPGRSRRTAGRLASTTAPTVTAAEAVVAEIERPAAAVAPRPGDVADPATAEALF